MAVKIQSWVVFKQIRILQSLLYTRKIKLDNLSPDLCAIFRRNELRQGFILSQQQLHTGRRT